MKPSKQILLSILHWSLLLGFIAIVEWLFGWQTLFASWQALSWSSLMIAVLLMVFTYQLRALRLYDYFQLGQREGRWMNALLTFRLMLLHNVLNNLLPARTGEISFPVLMKRYFAVDYLHSIPALFWFRLLDLHTILGIASIPLLSWFVPQTLAVALFSVWFMLPFGIFIAQHRLQGWLMERNAQQSCSKGQAILLNLLNGLPSSVSAFWRSWLLTIINWLVKLLVLAWILLELTELEFAGDVALAAVIGGELTSVLPFHAPGGVGTYEAGIVTVLSSASSFLPTMGAMPLKQAMALAINVHLFVLAASMVGGLIAWLLPKKPKVQETRDA